MYNTINDLQNTEYLIVTNKYNSKLQVKRHINPKKWMKVSFHCYRYIYKSNTSYDEEEEGNLQ